MSSTPVDKEKTPEKAPVESPMSLLAPPVPTAVPLSSPASPSSMMASGLGSGLGLEPRSDRPAPPETASRGSGEKKRASTREKKTTESGALLQKLARPMVFQSVDIPLQQKIVANLETAIPRIEEANLSHKQEIDAALNKLREQFGNPKVKMPLAEYEQRRDRLLAQRPPDLAAPVLYIGSIVLDEVPASPDDDRLMMARARLEETDNAIDAPFNAHGLPAMARVEGEVVQNTLATMKRAGQIDYLRSSGFVGRDWKIIVEIHYYRDRSGAEPNLHKDTLGQTLFVNLNYTNETPMAGPEFVVNPPTVATHEDFIAQTLPEQFRDDLDSTREAPAPTMIETVELPAHSVVAFVDEAIHHATPKVGHRTITIKRLREFLITDADYKDHYAAAKKAFEDSSAQGKWAYTPWWSFSAYFTEKLTKAEKNRWGALIALSKRKDDLTVTRADLAKAGMTHEQVDRIHQSKKLAEFNSVNIPGRARADGATGRLPLESAPGTPLPLKREMSDRALNKKLPALLPPSTPRRFFRTWVRAVPVKKTALPAPSPSASTSAASGTASTGPKPPPPMMKVESPTSTGSDLKTPP